MESDFVKDLDARREVLLYLKLPLWFSLPTPVGDYRPDWAIVMDQEDAEGMPGLYLVAETEGSLEEGDLRPDERRKIAWRGGAFWFEAVRRGGSLGDVDYKAVANASELP